MAVNLKHEQYRVNKPIWQKCRDAADGQDVVHSQGELYLPRLSKQNDDEYHAYLDRASFFNATQRTIDAMSGLLFRKEPEQNFPKGIEPWLNNIDLKGNNLSNFVEKVADEVIEAGRLGILVDHPTVVLPEGVELTKADAQSANYRPFLVQYKAESIINWNVKVINNIETLSLVVLEEVSEELNSEFEVTTEKQYRVLGLDKSGLYFQQIYILLDEKEETFQIEPPVYPLINGKPFNYIPFVFISGRGLSPDVEKSPVIDLVNVNFSHYKSSADIEHAAHFTALPTPVITGHSIDEGDRMSIGSSEAWILPEEGAKAFYLEFQGTGLETLEKRLERKEQQMAALGARMLISEKLAAESTETHIIKRQGENSALSSVAQSISDGITKALKILSTWGGIESSELEYKINKDFISTPMDAQKLTALVQALMSGAIAFSDFVAQLQQGEIIAVERTAEDIKEEIDNAGISAPQLGATQ